MSIETQRCLAHHAVLAQQRNVSRETTAMPIDYSSWRQTCWKATKQSFDRPESCRRVGRKKCLLRDSARIANQIWWRDRKVVSRRITMRWSRIMDYLTVFSPIKKERICALHWKGFSNGSRAASFVFIGWWQWSTEISTWLNRLITVEYGLFIV